MEKHRGGLVLGLAIAGFICFPTAIVAFFFAKGDLKKMAAGQMDKSGEGMTKAAKIVSLIMIVLAVIGIIANIAIMVMAGGAAVAGGGMEVLDGAPIEMTTPSGN